MPEALRVAVGAARFGKAARPSVRRDTPPRRWRDRAEPEGEIFDESSMEILAGCA